MKKVDLYAGQELSEALLSIKLEAKLCGEDCFAEFNGKEIYSTDSIDDAYNRVLGCSYNEHLAKVAECRIQREKKEQEFREKIPELTESYRSKARGIIAEKDLEHWDRIVPVRLSDLYHGWELRCTLDIVKIMNNTEQPIGARVEKAKEAFIKQGHSGMSARLMFAMINVFSPNGYELVEELKSKV